MCAVDLVAVFRRTPSFGTPSIIAQSDVICSKLGPTFLVCVSDTGRVWLSQTNRASHLLAVDRIDYCCHLKVDCTARAGFPAPLSQLKEN